MSGTHRRARSNVRFLADCRFPFRLKGSVSSYSVSWKTPLTSITVLLLRELARREILRARNTSRRAWKPPYAVHTSPQAPPHRLETRLVSMSSLEPLSSSSHHSRLDGAL